MNNPKIARNKKTRNKKQKGNRVSINRSFPHFKRINELAYFFICV
jgi:hypothetical protein